MNENMPPPPPRRARQRQRGKSPSKTPHRASRPSIKMSDSSIETALNAALKTPRGRVKQSSSVLSNGSRASSCPTSAMTFLPSNHGRQRREQRSIGIRALKAALKHGQRTRTSVPGRSKYCYNGITFIVDDATKREVTSYATVLDLPPRHITKDMWDRHVWARRNILQRPDHFCKSHSVILVDISGSMRNSDVKGARSRLGAVWHALATDYIKNRIDTGNGGDADAISVILMGETAQLHPHLNNAPTDWVTYNAVLKIFREGKITPQGHACYRPALTMAEQILTQHHSSSCALALTIMSDGRPSDHALFGGSYEDNTKSIASCVASLSSKLGKRLTVSAVGMGSANQFETLKTMTEMAENHESKGLFQVPSMSSSSIAAAISSIASSLTETQTNMASNRKVRMMTRENRQKMPLLTEMVNPQEFQIYMGNDVEHMIFDPSSGERSFKKVRLQHPEARGVAVARKAFGEGTERFAYQFFEVASDGKTVVGEPMVAKESKFVAEDTSNYADQSEKFVRRFCRINQQAQKAADSFNAKLDTIKRLDPDTVRVSFCPCSLYCVNDPEKGKHSLGVERRLFGHFQKWNSNNGWLKARTPHKANNSVGPTAKERGPDSNIEGVARLATIMEEDVEPDVHGSSVGAAIEIDMDVDDEEEGSFLFFSHNEVAQAFSHFSYIFGGRRSLICDLQGVVDRQKKVLQFTDPVIHYHDVFKEDKRGQYGRTDRGEKGIDDFLKSHECNGLCEVVTKGFLEVKK